MLFDKILKKSNEFGDHLYQMKDKYDANNLVIANLARISNYVSDEELNVGPMYEETEQKYIFESFIDNDKIKYREIFTGFVANDEEEYFMLPYVVNPKPLVDYFPDTLGTKIPKLSFIWMLNDINFMVEKNKSRELKKY